ncbi:MAG TPA: hypothetical protein VEB18_02250 [Candidatus Paceibacterota bacterium]|nr:hypothetical protein [Candidatus Paceibacterota bacterium]
MTTWQRTPHSVDTQKVETFTGEGAYHGSTKQKPPGAPQPPLATVPEARPTTLERYVEEGRTTIESFTARFPNRLRLVEQLTVPTQEEVRDDGVTFCWCPFEEALRVAGPLTRDVLNRMLRGLTYRKRYIYIDSKIQYFEPGDLPVDSCLRHVDGSIAVRDERVLRFGASVLHDMRARLEDKDPPQYLAYQSSDHCATGFLNAGLRLRMPELIPNFNDFDAAVREQGLPELSHPAGAILAYDGLTVHWATPARSAGWRLWIRCTETDVEIKPSASIIECYGTVFRPAR